MTGTAATESTEFESIYKLKVTIVPTNKPMIRKVPSSLPSMVYIFLNCTSGPYMQERILKEKGEKTLNVIFPF